MTAWENRTGFVTLVRKETSRFLKVFIQTIVSPIISAGLYMLVFGVSLSSLLRNQQGFTYLEFLVPGLVALSSLNNALQNSASSIMISKFHGDLQDLRLIPLAPDQIALAYVLACVFRGGIVGMLVLLLGQAVFFLLTGGWIGLAHPAGLLAFLVLGCTIFGNLGICSGFLAKSFDHINAFANFVILPLIYLGGVFFSMEILHPVFQTAARFNPLLYLINGIRWSVLGASDIPASICLVAALIFALISFALARLAVAKGSYQRF
ncbi:MAG: ABC transporter permease [Elusimicrobiota bacterium]